MPAYLRTLPRHVLPSPDDEAPMSSACPIFTADPAIVGGRFRLGPVLAGGGMSTVYEAEHLALCTPVALKIIDAVYAAIPEVAQRFEQEGALLARLARLTDHVVRPLDAGVHRGLPYLVMERLVGETLAQLVAREGPLPLETVADFVTQTARGLTAAHGVGIIHRDIKPANVFVCIRDGAPRIKLLDMGIAKKLDVTSSPMPTRPMGTAEVMAPEQWTGAPVDVRTDTWALGVLAFYMVTGQLPFSRKSLHELHRLVCDSDEPPPSVETFVLDLPEELDELFARALARGREERFGSAAEMAEAFAGIADAA